MIDRACPRVSIGMPVYNGEPFVAEAIESILSQTFTNLELIVSDNASDDGTAATCQRYAARDARVHYVRNPRNLGLAANFRRVVELARAPYFKLATADDVSAPLLVERCVEVLDAKPEVVLCYAPATVIDAAGRTLCLYDDNLECRSSRPAERFRYVLAHIRKVNVLQGVMRTAELKRTGLLALFPGSDVVLVAELALHGQSRELRDRLFFRRMHEQAFSSETTDAGRQARMGPGKRAGLVVWKHYAALLGTVGRAPLTVRERIELVGFVLRLACAARRSLFDELRGSGRRTGSA